MSVTAEKFREVMGHFATGVTVVTTRDAEGNPYGLTVNSFTSLSLKPMLVLVCLDNALRGLRLFQGNSRFGVNILAEDQQDLSTHFARQGTDRSQHIYLTGETGVPLLEGVLASFECQVVGWHPGGDHTIMVGEVKSARTADSGKGPLLYFLGCYRQLAGS